LLKPPLTPSKGLRIEKSLQGCVKEWQISLNKKFIYI